MTAGKKKIRQALFVSGPSAGGKTTLINQLMAGQLDPSIAEHLPNEAACWRYVDGNNILKRNLNLTNVFPDSDISGIIIHYDFVHIIEVGFSEDYRKDPVFDILTDCDQVIFCDVRPTAERLVQQFLLRQRDQHSRKGRLRIFWRKAVHLPLKRLRQKFKGQQRLAKDDIYRNPEWVDSCYRRWDVFLRSSRNLCNSVTLMRVEPVGASAEEAEFRLIKPLLDEAN